MKASFPVSLQAKPQETVGRKTTGPHRKTEGQPGCLLQTTPGVTLGRKATGPELRTAGLPEKILQIKI